ncbi:MAG: helix-turn-helix transcriptional regulator [Verrucomicrobiia bacterium]
MAIDLEEFGLYLRRLRESRGLSLRQAAAKAGISSAYLSQVEGGKRGKRKKGEQFAPHPHILKKLADLYHVEPMGILERAEYVQTEAHYDGFSEQREIDRVFDFVICDPALKHVFTALDKRAIVNRYETLTGRKLITWAGDNAQSSAKKTEFAGLTLFDGILHAETVHATLSLKEVANELACDVSVVEKYVANGWLHATKDSTGNLCVEKQALRDFKDYAVRDGLRLREACRHAHKPYTPEDFVNAVIALHAPKPLPEVTLQVIERRKKNRRTPVSGEAQAQENAAVLEEVKAHPVYRKESKEHPVRSVFPVSDDALKQSQKLKRTKRESRGER